MEARKLIASPDKMLSMLHRITKVKNESETGRYIRIIRNAIFFGRRGLPPSLAMTDPAAFRVLSKGITKLYLKGVL